MANKPSTETSAQDVQKAAAEWVVFTKGITIAGAVTAVVTALVIAIIL